MTRDRDQLIISEIPRAERIAVRFATRYHRDFDEITAVAFFGLTKAGTDFDPARGLKFTTYARYRIEGEIMDHVRADGLVPKEEMRRRRDPVYNATQAPLYHTWRVAKVIDSMTAPNRTDTGLFCRDVRALLNRLPPRHAFVMRARFYEERTARDIAGELGVTETRVVQMWREAEKKLRAEAEAVGLKLDDIL